MERVAVVLGKMNSGGIETVVMDYYTNLDYSRYQFDFFVDERSNNIDYLAISRRGGRVFLLPPIKKIFEYNKALKAYLKQEGYKIMHVHLNTLSVVALRIGKKVGVPIRISHNHTTSNKKEVIRHLTKLILRPFANKYLTDRCACSEYAGRWLFGKRNAKKGRVKIINNAIDIDKFKFDLTSRDKTRRELNVVDNFVIGNIGRFVPQKNQKFLIDVFKEVVILNPNARLVLVGDGKLKDDLIKRASSYNVLDKVIFVEPRRDVEKLYSAFDCLALPSIYEGLGRVVIEAEASGLYSVCSLAVPKEVDLTSLVKFLPIKNKNKKEWANALLSANSNREIDYKKPIQDGGYDIKEQSAILASWYDELMLKHGLENIQKAQEDKPLISILIAVYNVEKYLKQSIDSALNQTYPNIQLVIVDDGSTDNSREICQSYTIDDRVKLIRQENKGLAEVRNVAIKNADGKYVVFLDGDDFLSPYHVENLYNAMISGNTQIASCDFLKYYDGEKLPVYQRSYEYRVLEQKEYLEEALLQKTECSACAKLYSIDIVKNLVYPKGVLYEDLAAFPSLMDKIERISLIANRDYIYRQNKQSILHKTFSEKDKDCIKFIENLKAYVKENFSSLMGEMICREFSVYCHLFLRINKKKNPQEYKLYWAKIKEYRRVVIKEKSARKKNKMACLLSYFGKRIFKTAYKLI